MCPLAVADTAKLPASNQPLSQDEVRQMDAYWRAANYPSVGQIYLLENPLLREMPVIRKQTVREHPEIAQILAELKDKISNEEMRRLNYAVDGQHRDAKEAVREFLRSKELLQ